jgi:hypothetical protein
VPPSTFPSTAPGSATSTRVPLNGHPAPGQPAPGQTPSLPPCG